MNAVAAHGSGLTNLVFLAKNTVVVQVVPLGRMEGLAMDEYGGGKHVVGGAPADATGVPGPMPIHKQSWSLGKDIFLRQQDVRLDLRRFRPVLEKDIRMLR
ncbi:uncharacterized protein C2845_PM08G02810 [Panicum miliaceum]|uniref:Uncharacterized protein n=1 Tax=Panicum miliaceum TaxID=4540 RepID=A0A3L6QX11_PANMI|nr:uncharacterized protein C2845_PM08G02810 [Panicum miliaceum]